MQFGKVISFKNFEHFFVNFKKNFILIFFAILFIVGFIISTCLYDKNSFESVFKNITEEFINIRNNGTFLKISINSFLKNFTYLILMFFLGTSVLGISVLPFVSIICGIYYGGIFSVLYSVYSFNGIVYSMVFVLPCAVLFSAVLMRSAKESVEFSIKTARLTFSRSMPYSLYFDFKNYCSKFLIFAISILIISFIDAFLAFNFSDNIKL